MTLDEHISELSRKIEHDQDILDFLEDYKAYEKAFKLACKELGMAYGDKGKDHKYWETYFIKQTWEEE